MLSGDTFDKSYIKGQISAHRDTLKLLHKEIATGQDEDAKAFAKSILPTVQGHLKAIRVLASASTGVTESQPPYLPGGGKPHRQGGFLRSSCGKPETLQPTASIPV